MESKTDFPGVALVTGAASGKLNIPEPLIGRPWKQEHMRLSTPMQPLGDILIAFSYARDRFRSRERLREGWLYKNPPRGSERVGSAEDPGNFEHFGRLDYAVNCAGINGINANHAPTNSTETSVEYFDKINGINYRGTWMANRAYLDIMMKQEPLPSHDAETPGREQRGSIVNLSSGLGVTGMPKNPVYSASKAAIIALTRNDAIDYSEHKIRINCVCPGLIDTPMTAAMGDDPGAMEWVVNSTPLKRMGQANEIADCCVFLSSTRASWVQGQSLVADGGIVLL